MKEPKACRVPLLVANQATMNQNVYTEDCLRSAAKVDPRYIYDESTKTLYYHLLADEEAEETVVPTAALDTKFPEDLPPHRNRIAMLALRDLVNDTNMGFQDVQIPYTKVWLFVRTIIGDPHLRAQTLLEALQLAGAASNEEIVKFSDYSETSTTAHELMRNYFLKK